jgi:hypothetical protein
VMDALKKPLPTNAALVIRLFTLMARCTVAQC